MLYNRKSSLGSALPSKRPKRIIKKSRLANDLDYDDDTFDDDENARNDFYPSDDTGEDTNEGVSEATSDNDATLVMGGKGMVDDDGDELVSDEEGASDEFNENKSKMNKRFSNNNAHNPRHFKEEWNSGEDTNERYCICKDISYGDMVMCDEQGVSCFFFLNFDLVGFELRIS